MRSPAVPRPADPRRVRGAPEPADCRLTFSTPGLPSASPPRPAQRFSTPACRARPGPSPAGCSHRPARPGR